MAPLTPSPVGNDAQPTDTSNLSVYVLLPASAAAQQVPTPIVNAGRPTNLFTRQSSSSVPSTKTKNDAQGLGGAEDANRVSVASRRLSLAPGLGTSAVTPLSPTSFDPIALASAATPRRSTDEAQTTSTTTPPPFGSRSSISAASSSSGSPSSAIPAFGAKRSSTGVPRASGGRRRPQTATSSTHNIASGLVGAATGRASLAVPGGVGSYANRRPGWEADDVVDTLRNNGLEVTIVRQAAQLRSVLDPSSEPTIASTHIARPNDPTEPFINVILVPLSDTTALPTLSLLLSRGTTPTAVCFQQDLLDRARKTEEEWLNKAVEQIKTVAKMREQLPVPPPTQSDGHNSPVIIAYSANPNLSPTAVAACIAAGAAGVLKPPYSYDTAEAVRRVVRAYRDGTDLSAALQSPRSRMQTPSLASSSDPSIPEEPTVILPPTALSMGAEHEGEKVLSAMVHRRMSADTEGLQQRRPSVSGAPGSTSLQSPSSPHDLGDHNFIAASFTYHYNSHDDRRRSVDVGGLSLALKRAQKVFEMATPINVSKPVFSDVIAQIKNGLDISGTPKNDGRDESDLVGNDFGKDMEIAELLSAMYSQTMMTIQVQMSDYDELSAPLTPEHRARLVDQLSGWNFKPHTLAEGDLFRVACLLFETILNTEGLVELNLERDQVNRLLFAIRAIYHAPNPYHNYVHAIDVLQATYTFLVDIGVAPPYSYMRTWTSEKPVWKRSESAAANDAGTRRAREVLGPQDVFAIIVAAIGHDVGHPGLSNAFMKNAKVPLSQVYEDKSVLENMHCMLIVQLLRKHGFRYLVEGPPSPRATVKFDQKAFRKVLYSSVLATDMSLHFAWIAKLKECDERLKAGKVGTDEDDRIMIAQALIKCADISNPTRPIDISQHWSSVLLEEWAKQASLEQDLDLPVSVVASADASLQANGQIGFIDLFTQPLFEAVAEALPQIQVYADSCASNRALWKTRLDQLHAAAEAAETDGGSMTPQLIQPAIEGESKDERFRTLFPLLLPDSLVASMVESSSQPSSPTTPEGQGYESGSSRFPGTDAFSAHSTESREREIGTPEPESGHHRERTRETENQNQNQPESPASKAMRAVYHAKLINQKNRSAGLISLARTAAAGGAGEGRRMSTPEVQVSRP